MPLNGRQPPFPPQFSPPYQGREIPRGMMLMVDPRTGQCCGDLGLVMEQIRAALEQGRVQSLPEEITSLRGLGPGNRGGTAVFTPLEVGNAKRILDVRPQAEGAWEYAVTLGITPEGEETDDPLVDSEACFQAAISWGVGGGSFNAVVDVGRGTVINVCGGSLTVAAVRLPPIGPLPADLGSYVLSASVGYGGVGRPASTATFTDRLGVLGGGMTARSRVPNFARAFTIVTSTVGPETAPPAYIGMRADVLASTASLVTNTFEYLVGTNASGQRETQFPLFNGARYVDVTSLAAEPGTTAFVQVIYSLAL